MRGVVAGAACVTLLLVGCTSDDETDATTFTPVAASAATEITHDESWVRQPLPRMDGVIVRMEFSDDLTRPDAAYIFATEICRDLGVTALARRLQVEPEPDAVARAYAARHSGDSRRDATREGCTRGLFGKSP